MSQIGVFLGKMLSGESVIREFSTVGIDDNIREKVYLKAGNRVLDVSGNQWLVGLDPRVIGIWLEGDDREGMELSGEYSLNFQDDHDALAVVRLAYFDMIKEEDGT